MIRPFRDRIWYLACWVAVPMTLLAMRSPAEEATLDPLAVAATHPIVFDRPGPTFFSGALLGNGGLGALVCTRSDAIMIHFGHNDVWDQRIGLNNLDELGTFDEVFAKMRAIPADVQEMSKDPWYEHYRVTSKQNYRESYPRPFPCGTLVLGFDPRHVEMLGREVDIANGRCRINLLADGRPVWAEVFVEIGPDRLWVRLLDENDRPAPPVFDRIRLFEDPKTPEEIPRRTAIENPTENTLGFRQVLPYRPPRAENANEPHPNDRAFSIAVRTSAELMEGTWPTTHGERREPEEFERTIAGSAPFYVVAQLDHAANEILPRGMPAMPEPNEPEFDAAFDRTEAAWAIYWRKSGVRLPGPSDGDSAFLERTWYRNQYFFNCATRPESAWPGLYANWSYGDIGTMWHGDYHLDYNVQQPTWLTFSSNRVDKHLAYVNTLRDYWLPVSRNWAQHFYGMRGAYFTVTLYPIEMQINPYPVPPWGYMVSCTPWAVQSLWWHYEYTLDEEFLREQGFGPIREAVLFLVDYMTRPEAHGEAWGDDKYHVFPSAVPELYDFRAGFPYNKDPLPDLALIKFVFNAYLEAVRVLDVEVQEGETIDKVREILGHFPEYPRAESQFGEIYVNVVGEDPDIVQNAPASMMHVFPGEEYGMDAPPDVSEILTNTWRNLRTEGGNDLVFRNLQGARLGLLDLDAFVRELRYALMDNGTFSDRVRQGHGRYDDTTNHYFMDEMGIWTENFAVPAVLNECLMQSWNGEIRLYPNWPADRDASFTTLRAKGAFLVSAEQRDGSVQWVEVFSEKGAALHMRSPWPAGARVTIDGSTRVIEGERIQLETRPAQTIRMAPIEE
jgi:hypothetical protein